MQTNQNYTQCKTAQMLHFAPPVQSNQSYEWIDLTKGKYMLSRLVLIKYSSPEHRRQLLIGIKANLQRFVDQNDIETLKKLNRFGIGEIVNND